MVAEIEWIHILIILEKCKYNLWRELNKNKQKLSRCMSACPVKCMLMPSGANLTGVCVRLPCEIHEVTAMRISPGWLKLSLSFAFSAS